MSSFLLSIKHTDVIDVILLEGKSLLQRNSWLFRNLSIANKVNSNQLGANKVESLHKPAILMSCYWALKQTSSELLFDEIKRLSKKYRHNPIWIRGAFNLPDSLGNQVPEWQLGNQLSSSRQLSNLVRPAKRQVYLHYVNLHL